LQGSEASSTLLTASKQVEGESGGDRERPLGYSEVKPEDLYGHGSSQLDGHLRGASAQFRAEPSSGHHRESGRSGRRSGGTVVVHSVRPDGADHPVPALHALSTFLVRKSTHPRLARPKDVD
jgi:hypothetical protein